jgi:hypothetical protein
LLPQAISKHRIQNSKLTAKQQELREEALHWQIEANARKLQQYKDASAKVDEIVYNDYAVGFVSGIIASESGQRELKRIVDNPTVEDMKIFTENVVKQTLDKAANERKIRLKNRLSNL